jgi:hypothetical protein
MISDLPYFGQRPHVLPAQGAALVIDKRNPLSAQRANRSISLPCRTDWPVGPTQHIFTSTCPQCIAQGWENFRPFITAQSKGISK